MGGSSPPATRSTTITDLNVDALAHCADFLNLHDVCNLALTCTHLKRAAYSNPVWQRFYREQWNLELPSDSLRLSGARDLYVARHTALRQFKFDDPFAVDIYINARAVNHLILRENQYIYSQGSNIEVVNFNDNPDGPLPTSFARVHRLNDHKARITSMRLLPLDEISSRGEAQSDQNVLVTSSCDHSIRMWLKGSCVRCFRGHNGPVLSLSNKLLGDSKVLASGGEDGTVRLWSLSGSGRRGQHALRATLYGHEKPVNLVSVAGHKTSLLVTISRDSKVRVWDTATSSAVRSSCCVGTTSVAGAPVSMKCHESLAYVAAGSSVTAIDLRTMQKVITAAVHKPKLYSFEIIPSKSLICTGGDGRAMLWDVRRNQEPLKPEPIAELDGHCGRVTLLHMDPYKIVTGGPDDLYINLWEADTGAQINSMLSCCKEEGDDKFCTDAMAVYGCRIITAGFCSHWGIMRFRDYSNATMPLTKLENEPPSKFWGSPSGGVGDD